MMQAHTAPPVWPDSADALADEHVCPSCFHPVTLPDCRVCGFAFTDARAADVLGIGREMFALEDRRRTIIDAIIESATATSETAAASALPVEAARVEAVPAEVAPVVSRIADVTGMPVTSVSVDLRAAAPPAPADVAPAATVPPAASVPSPRPPRRRLTVPVLLLIVGVSLVGIAAVFFLLLAWFVADILVRALIIGAITLATIATASMLRRRSLTATAEGIGALGVILLALDAWALRANDLFGAGSMEPAVYAGSAALAVGVVCRVWSRLSHLRGPDLAALLALPAGLGLLVAGLLPLDTETAIAAGLIGAAAGGLAHALPAPWSAARDRLDSVPERTALAAIGVASLIAGAGVAAFAGLDDVATPLWSGAAIIVVGVAHVLVLRERRGEEPLPGARALAATAAAVAAVAAASLGWQLAARSDLPVYEFLAAPVIAVVVAVALDRVRTRRFALRLEPSADADADADAGTVAPRRGILSLSVSVATVAAGGVAVVSTLWLLVQSLRSTAAIAWTWEAWRTPVFAMSAGDAATAVILTAVASAIIAVLLFLTPSAGRPGMRDARPAVAAVLVVAGAAGTGIPALIVGVAAVVAIAALIALGRGSSRIGWGIAAGLGAAAAFTAGVAAPWLWIIGVLIAVAVPIAARRLVRPHGAAAVLLALAPIGVGVLTALIAPTAISAAFAVPADAAGGFALLHWTALITLAAAVAVPLDPPSRTAVALSSYVLFAVSLLSLVITPAGASSTSTGATVSTVLGEPALAIVRCALTLALLSIVALGRTPVGALPSKAAAALVAPMAAATGTAALETLRSSDQAAFALLAVATAAAVAWAGALTPARAYRVDPLATTDAEVERPGPAPFPVFVRRALDLGAVVTALAWAWTGSFELAWAMLALVAVGIAATSVTRGWAAPVFAGSIAAIETRAPGVPLSEAPRRLLVWPAFAAATLALWFWLSSEVMDEWVLEPFVLPPAVGLVVLGVVLVWLRRRVEAAIAVVSSFALGLVVLAIAGWSGTPARGTIVALVAAALCILLAWTPLRRVRGPAIAGAATAIVAIALVTIERALHEPSATAWLLLLVAAGFASAAGLVRGAPAVASGADDASPALPHEVVYAFVIPPVALIAAALATLPSVDEPVVLSAALGVLALVHVASAALHRLPFAATARWTALAGAFTVGAFGIVSGTARAIEAITIPLAALTLAGAALAMLRRHRAGLEWPGAERAVWLAGLVVAVLPSVLAPANDPRTWLVVCGALLAAVGSLVAPISDDTRLKAPSALLLTTAAVVMGLRALFDPAVESGEFAAIVAGIGAIAVAAVLVWMSDAEHTSHAGAAVAGIGAALLVAWAAVRADGTLAQTTLAVCIAGIASVGGAWLLRLPKWTGIGSVLALGGVVIAAIAAGARFLTIAPTPGSGIEPDFWAVAVVAVFVAAGVMALRSSPSRTTAAIVGAAFAAVVVVFAVAEAALLAWADSDELRATLTMTALAAVGVVGVVWRARLGLALAVTAAVASATFGIIALTAFGVRPVELVTVPPALGLIALGVRSLRRDSVARTWPALGPGLVLLTVPSLLHDFGESELWRVVALGVVAIVLVVIGAVFKLQAPLVLGSIVLLVHAVAQLWPWISSAYVAVPWWLWLGIGGALLIFIAARYEKRMRELRAAFAAVVSLR